jgi:hypothetical protein
MLNEAATSECSASLRMCICICVFGSLAPCRKERFQGHHSSPILSPFSNVATSGCSDPNKRFGMCGCAAPPAAEPALPRTAPCAIARAFHVEDEGQFGGRRRGLGPLLGAQGVLEHFQRPRVVPGTACLLGRPAPPCRGSCGRRAHSGRAQRGIHEPLLRGQRPRCRASSSFELREVAGLVEPEYVAHRLDFLL